MKQNTFAENCAKHLLLIICLVIFYFPLRSFLAGFQPNNYDSTILVSSLLIMSCLFADYAFTYTSSDLTNVPERYLDHAITAIVIFSTGALLEISIVSLNFKLQTEFKLLELVAFLFYISLVLYDFWDLNRALKKYQ